MSDTATVDIPNIPKFDMRGFLIGLIPNLFIDIALPIIIYTLLKPHTTDLVALSASAVPPIISNIVSIMRSRNLDVFGTIILLGIAVSIVAIFLGGDPRILLIRESLVTGAIGLACFFSLLLPKPLMFYFSRHFATGANPGKNTWFDSLWRYPAFRRMNYLITIVWGVAYVAEFILRGFLVLYVLTIPQALVISPIISNTVTICLIAWTVIYSTRRARRGRETMEKLRQENQEGLNENLKKESGS